MYVEIYNTAQTNGRWNLFCCLMFACFFRFFFCLVSKYVHFLWYSLYNRFKLKPYTSTWFVKLENSTVATMYQVTFFKGYNPPFLVLSATQRTSRQLDETSHNRYHTLCRLSLVQHSLHGSTTRTLSLGFCIDRHRQNHLLFALSRQENLRIPHLLRFYLFCFELPLYSK